MKQTEQVCCLRRLDLEALTGCSPLPQGSFPGPGLAQVLALPQFFLPRSHAEHDPGYKQLIPYQLFYCLGRYFVYQRGGGVGEGRLAGRLSIGIGGHINTGDAGGSNRLSEEGYHAALRREQEEELLGTGHLSGPCVGWINDDSDPVGQVHLGAVHLCLVESESAITLRAHGEDLHPCGWWTTRKIRDEAARFEKWSMLALEVVSLPAGETP